MPVVTYPILYVDDVAQWYRAYMVDAPDHVDLIVEWLKAWCRSTQRGPYRATLDLADKLAACGLGDTVARACTQHPERARQWMQADIVRMVLGRGDG